MKNKGQALVLFIILIPVFLVITAIFVDAGINSYNKKRFESVSGDVLTMLLDNEKLNEVNYDNKEEIEGELLKRAVMLYDANEIGIDNLKIEVLYDKKISLFNTYEHYSFMNSLFGRGNGKRYISVNAVGYLKDGEKVIEFKDGSNEN